MRFRPYGFHHAQANSQVAPLVVVRVATQEGERVYCSVGMTDAEIWNVPPVTGDLVVISIEPRVLSYGAMRETGSILPTIALRGKRSREVGSVEVALRNDDDHFGRLLARSGAATVGQANLFLAQQITIAIGFRGLSPQEFMLRFRGVIQEQLLTREQFTLRAETA